MSTITVPLPHERLERLKSLALEVGVSPEELARATLEEWLSRPREDFVWAARHVLEKNGDLYRRLEGARAKARRRKGGIMAKLKKIRIKGPRDFAENVDLYLSGEKRVQ